jgi:hypothetical protein
MTSNITRRAALGALAIAPTLSLAAPVDAVVPLWEQRQTHVEALARFKREYFDAYERLPDWAKPGERCIDQDGTPCGEIVWHTRDLTVAPPTREGAVRVVRPSISEARNDFDSFVRVLCGTPELPGYEARRAKARATMRNRILAMTARLKERKRLNSELGLDRLDDLMMVECDSIRVAEDAIEVLAPGPNRTAALVMARVSQDCDKDSTASGSGYCGVMAVALVALEALLPSLSGMIRDHAALYVANPIMPFSEMPFAAG